MEGKASKQSSKGGYKTPSSVFPTHPTRGVGEGPKRKRERGGVHVIHEAEIKRKPDVTKCRQL